MIRTRSLNAKALSTWLEESVTGSPGTGYSHRLLEERGDRRLVLEDLKGYVQEAHEDTKQKIRLALSPTLAPYATPQQDPAFGYPQHLHLSTLMGYFGEVFAGLIVEHRPVQGQRGWKVPAFPFRFHRVAFQALQDRRDLELQDSHTGPIDDSGASLPGRAGNDLLAFRIGEQGELHALLVCEAKCFASHNATKATQAHRQLGASSAIRCPSGVADLIELLADYDTPSAREWRQSLQRFYLTQNRKIPRGDVFVYITGNKPTSRKTWLSSQKPDPAYKGSGPLEAIEIHLDDLQALVKGIYRSQS